MRKRFVLLALVVCLAPGGARAATTEADYLALRSKHVAKIKAMRKAKADDEKIAQEDEKLRDDLGRRLQDVLGPVAVSGFPNTGMIMIDSLSPDDENANTLDALAYANSADDAPKLFVTTPGLMRRWLATRAQSPAVRRNFRIPTDFAAAAKTEGFYTNSLSGESGFGKAAEIAVTKPEGIDHVTALLGGWSETTFDRAPTSRIMIAARKGERIYIIDAPSNTEASIAACDELFDKATKEAEKLRADYDKGGGKSDKLLDRANVIDQKASESDAACFAEHAPKEKFYPALVKAAQDYVDRLAASKP